jgi:hypothetical protein
LIRRAVPRNLRCCRRPDFSYFPAVLKLTRQEQLVLSVVLGLLLVGWAVKAWRLAHPDVPPLVDSGTPQDATD